MQSHNIQPALACVEILYSENPSIAAKQVFQSMSAADEYIAAALAISPVPSAGEGYQKTIFGLTWNDGLSIRGRVDLTSGQSPSPIRDNAIRGCRLQVTAFGARHPSVSAEAADVARRALSRLVPQRRDADETWPGIDD